LIWVAIWEVWCEMVGVVTLRNVGVTPDGEETYSNTTTTGNQWRTYFTRPMRFTFPDGSRSNSAKLTAVEYGSITFANAREDDEKHTVSLNRISSKLFKLKDLRWD
jgi:hypothetical protein